MACHADSQYFEFYQDMQSKVWPISLKPAFMLTEPILGQDIGIHSRWCCSRLPKAVEWNLHMEQGTFLHLLRMTPWTSPALSLHFQSFSVLMISRYRHFAALLARNPSNILVKWWWWMRLQETEPPLRSKKIPSFLPQRTKWPRFFVRPMTLSNYISPGDGINFWVKVCHFCRSHYCVWVLILFCFVVSAPVQFRFFQLPHQHLDWFEQFSESRWHFRRQNVSLVPF